jgi:hypothetical protein
LFSVHEICVMVLRSRKAALGLHDMDSLRSSQPSSFDRESGSERTILICNDRVGHHALAQMVCFRMSEQHVLTAVELLLDIRDREVLD